MSALIKFVNSVCVQTAVYWAPSTDTGYGKTFVTAVEINCRWDGKTKLVRAQNGEEVLSNGQILTQTEIVVGGRLWLGNLEALSESQKQNPMLVTGAAEVITVEKTPLFRSVNEAVQVVFV